MFSIQTTLFRGVDEKNRSWLGFLSVVIRAPGCLPPRKTDLLHEAFVLVVSGGCIASTLPKATVQQSTSP